MIAMGCNTVTQRREWQIPLMPHPFRTFGLSMEHQPEYAYYKKSFFRGDPAESLIRHVVGSRYNCEYWTGTHWKQLRDSLDWLSREDDYWPISEYEATVEMPRLAVRYEECRREMQAEQERIERRKIENERLGRTLHRLGGEWTPMEKAAIALHEMFSSLVAAGFTKDEATTIVSQVMVGVSAQKQLPFVEGLRLN